MRLARHAARMEDMGNTKFESNRTLEGLSCISEGCNEVDQDVRVWTGFSWVRIGSTGGLLWPR